MGTILQENTAAPAAPADPATTGVGSAADELRSRMASLKAKVQDAVQRREDEVKQRELEEAEEEKIRDQLRERQDRLAEDSRLLPLLQEAQQTLADFQSQLQQRLVTDKKDLEEFQQLKELLRILMNQRDKALEAAEAMEKTVVEKLSQSLDEFLKQVEDAEKRRADLEEQKKELDKEVGELGGYADRVVQGALAKLGTAGSKTAAAIGAVATAKNNGEYISGLQQYRKTLGWLHFKEKSAVDAVLKNIKLFKELDEKKQGASRAATEIEKINSQIGEMIENYKAYIVESERGGQREVI